MADMDLQVQIDLETRSFNKELSGLKRSVGNFGKDLADVGKIATGFIVGDLIVGGIGKITGAFVSGTKSILGYSSNLEQLQISFSTMLGSGEKAKTLIDEIKTAAAQTPFELPELQQGARSLLAFGVAQEKIVPTLTRIGDIASGTGNSVGELAEIYGKAKTQGRLFAEDVNQLTGRGIPIIQELAKQFKVSESQVKKLVEEGKVGFPQLEKAVESMTEKGGRFSGLMEAQSKSFAGIMSNITDSVNNTLSTIFVESGAFEFLKQLADEARVFLDGFGQGFLGAMSDIKEAIGGVTEEIGLLLSDMGIKFNNAGTNASSAMSAGQTSGKEFANVLVQIIGGVREGIKWLRDNRTEIKQTFTDGAKFARDFAKTLSDIVRLLNDARNAAEDANKKYQSFKGTVQSFNPINATKKIGGAIGFAKGGLVPRGNYLASGGFPAFVPKGSDTVPAMLTPGEGVASKQAIQNMLQGKAGNTIINIDLSNSVLTNSLINQMVNEVERVLNRNNELSSFGMR